MRLTLRQLSLYLQHIPVIMAKEALVESHIASLPYMDEDARAQVLHAWGKVSAGDKAPETFKEAWAGDKISFEDFTREIKEKVA